MDNALQNHRVRGLVVIGFSPMLRCLLVGSPDQKPQIFKEFLDRETYWVVNDLESKFWVQNFLRKQLGPIIHTDRVLRASEVWQKVLLEKDPSWQPLSSNIAEFLIEKWMTEILEEAPLKLSAKDAPKAYQTIGQILPLLSHFQGESAVDEWFGEQLDAKERWADWYEMGRRLWDRFLHKRLIPMEWMKGALVNDELPPLSQSHIVVDLGLDIDDVEGELFLNISRLQDVVVLVPESEKENEIYKNLMSRGQTEEYPFVDPASKVQFFKLPSMLAEVKQAVAQARQWLDEGVPLEGVAIISAQIENYWPTLYEHLQVEGIPAQKSVVTPLSQIPNFQKMMARVRLASEKILWGDAEQIFYKEEKIPDLSYRDFKSQFTHVYQVSDYQRNSSLKETLPQALSDEAELSFQEYMEAIVERIPEEDYSFLGILLEDLDDIYTLHEKLTVAKWTDFLEKYFSRTEKKLLSAPLEGIQILSLNSCQNAEMTHAVVVGLSESQLLESSNTSLSWADVEAIKLNFGFNLSHPDRHQLENHLKWFEKKELKEVIYTQGETDFSGRYQAPSMFWLQGAISQGHNLELDSPQTPRWDLLNQTNPGESVGWDKNRVENILGFIARDKGLGEFENVPYENLNLSASSYEEYFKCPFKLFSRKGLGLGNPPILDLDIDYMTRGRLLHKICEDLVSGNKFALSSEQIEKLVDKARESIEVPIYTEQVWTFLKPYYLEMTRSFMENERKWREDFPNTKTLGLEKFISTHIQLNAEGWEFNKKEGIPFRGVIDRIDINKQKQVVLIDYKTSDAGLTQYKSWIKNGKIQLALYSLALIEGVLDGHQYDVVGAFYYALKTLDRTKGFVLSESKSDFLPTKKMVREDLDNLIEETKSLVFKMTQEIVSGVNLPSPQNGDLKICEKCDWKKLCRNPELNL